MEKRKKLSGLVKVLVIVGAGAVVVFGNLGNLVRTVKLAIRRFK